MSFIDEPIHVLSCASSRFLYTMVYDPRDLSAAYFRCSVTVPGRGIGTDRDSLPDNVSNYFGRESARLADEWNRAHPDEDEPAARGAGKGGS